MDNFSEDVFFSFFPGGDGNILIGSVGLLKSTHLKVWQHELRWVFLFLRSKMGDMDKDKRIPCEDRVVVSSIFCFHPYLGKIPILTNIFQGGWNHQPV